MTRERMTAEQAETVWQIAQLTGRSIRDVSRAAARTPEHAAVFAAAVELATGEWTWLDGEAGQWRTDPAKQHAKLLRYADLLIEGEPCAAPSPSN
ncbi:hypothetical protein [Methylobacterium persicinum]|uniref:Uncharacterized protein n=1 Tax=Methylobacterium persicinum TaxID=374426 RepID=A0ABU0HVI3_9HYPH|nr:hypothetical protein [Methylobacterium persicinum]MDQ0445496.1 hypothetical protein [Methylobacterium persicinum]GJE40837.1 hypothetical protein KHHGKMAE_4936 [Methylobacterium persicinum]